MKRKGESESPSLKWIHRVREEHYRETRNLPVESWLRPIDPKKAAHACHRLGLKVRLPQAAKQGMRRRA